MDRRQGVHQHPRQALTGFDGRFQRAETAAMQHQPGTEFHQQEGCAGDLRVFAQVMAAGGERQFLPQPRKNPVFPGHVVGAGRQRAIRRTAQHHPGVVDPHQEVEIGQAADELARRRVRVQHQAVAGQIGGDARPVELAHVGLVAQGDAGRPGNCRRRNGWDSAHGGSLNRQPHLRPDASSRQAECGAAGVYLICSMSFSTHPPFSLSRSGP
ncbi:hypothetical protein D3C78_1339150 [compost metagenome]